MWLSYLYYCLCLFVAVVELHAMDAKMFKNFPIEKQEWILHVTEAYLIHDLYFLCLVRAFNKSNPKSLV